MFLVLRRGGVRAPHPLGHRALREALDPGEEELLRAQVVEGLLETLEPFLPPQDVAWEQERNRGQNQDETRRHFLDPGEVNGGSKRL